MDQNTNTSETNANNHGQKRDISKSRQTVQHRAQPVYYTTKAQATRGSEAETGEIRSDKIGSKERKHTNR